MNDVQELKNNACAAFPALNFKESGFPWDSGEQDLALR